MAVVLDKASMDSLAITAQGAECCLYGELLACTVKQTNKYIYAEFWQVKKQCYFVFKKNQHGFVL